MHAAAGARHYVRSLDQGQCLFVDTQQTVEHCEQVVDCVGGILSDMHTAANCA